MDQFAIRGCDGVPHRVDLRADPSCLALIEDLVARHQDLQFRRPPQPAAPRRALTQTRRHDAAGPSARPNSLPPGEQDTWLRLPVQTPSQVVEAAIIASERVRCDRRLELAVTVEVATRTGVLVFTPLRPGRRELAAAFTFTAAGESPLTAALLLDRSSDPVPVRAPQGVSRALLGTAWAAALVAYAELTCTPIPDREPPPQSDGVRRPAAGLSRSSSGRSRPGSGGHGAREPVTLRSIAEAVERLQSVSGFVRRLARGQNASGEAIAAAAALGIRVPPGCTWVRPHVRSTERLRVSLGSRSLW